MKFLLVSTFSAFTIVSCGAFAKDVADPMCAPLRAFVESVKPKETKELTFYTSWGSNFKDDPKPAMYAIKCTHGGYLPAKAVCDYLMKNGSIEFSGNNAEQALSCLSPQTVFGLHVELNEGDFSFTYGTSDHGSIVSLKYSGDTELGAMALKITAEGY